jgi:hypothetical protein
MVKPLYFLMLAVLYANAAYSTPQSAEKETSDEYQPFQLGLQVKNMHLWRGFKVTSAAMTGVDLGYASRDGRLRFGLWGGAGLTGQYSEFDYYLSYTHKGFTLSVWDINNFTDFPEANIFNYRRAVTSHFVDVTLAYQFQNDIPLTLSFSTIVQGRDTFVRSDGQIENAFSHYAEARYQLFTHEEIRFSAFAGGAFSLKNRAHFYGEKPNITNLGITALRIFDLGRHKLPVGVTSMWNPEQKYGAIELSIGIF